MSNYNVVEIGPNLKEDKLVKFEINSSMEEIVNFINLVESEMKVQEPDFFKLQSDCYELICRLPLPTYVLKTSFLLRGRENINGEVFNSTSQISYNPYLEKILAGRFNLEKEAVFYASIPTCSNGSSGQLTAICECCKGLMDENLNFTTKCVTVGKWDIVKPVRFVALTFNEDAESKSFHVKNINKPYLDFLSSACSKHDYDKCLKFFSLISKYATQKCEESKNYLLTTAYFHAIQKYYGKELGLLYSSSMTDCKGLNIVFSKEFIDHGNLKPVNAVMYRVIRDPNNSKGYNIFPCTNILSINEAERFNFQNIW